MSLDASYQKDTHLKQSSTIDPLLPIESQADDYPQWSPEAASRLGQLAQNKRPVDVAVAYNVKDKNYFEKIEEILIAIKNVRNDLNIFIYEGRVLRTTSPEIRCRLASTNLLLLLISPSFLGTDFCQCKEMEDAVTRHGNGKINVIPIIVRPMDLWKESLFGHLNPLPADGSALSAPGHNQSKVLNEISMALMSKIVELNCFTE